MYTVMVARWEVNIQNNRITLGKMLLLGLLVSGCKGLKRELVYPQPYLTTEESLYAIEMPDGEILFKESQNLIVSINISGNTITILPNKSFTGTSCDRMINVIITDAENSTIIGSQDICTFDTYILPEGLKDGERVDIQFQ
jgi:hypothetical protein